MSLFFGELSSTVTMSESDLGPVVDPAPSVQFNASTEKNYEKKHTLTVKVFLSDQHLTN